MCGAPHFRSNTKKYCCIYTLEGVFCDSSTVPCSVWYPGWSVVQWRPEQPAEDTVYSLILYINTSARAHTLTATCARGAQSYCLAHEYRKYSKYSAAVLYTFILCQSNAFQEFLQPHIAVWVGNKRPTCWVEFIYLTLTSWIGCVPWN